MIRLLTNLLLVLVLAGIYTLLSLYSGSLTLTMMGYEVTLAVKYAFVIGLALASLVWILARSVGSLDRFRTLRIEKRHTELHKKAIIAMEESMLSLLTNDAEDAFYQAERAQKLLPKQLLPRMLEVEALRKSNNVEAQKEQLTFLREQADTKRLEVYATTALIDIANQEEDRSTALTLSREWYQDIPKSQEAALTYYHQLKTSREWDEAHKMIGKLKKFKTSELNLLREEAVILFMQARKAHELSETVNQIVQKLEKAHSLRPSFLPITEMLVPLLLQKHRQRKAISIMERSWKDQPSMQLYPLYVSIYPNDTLKKRKSRVMRLVKQNQLHTMSKLAIARVMFENEERDNARERVKEVLAEHVHQDALRLLLEIEEQAGMDTEGLSQIRIRMLNAPRNAWTCKHCKHQEVKWSYACPSCHSVDSFRMSEAVMHEDTDAVSDSAPKELIEAD